MGVGGEYAAVGPDEFILVDGAFVELGEEDFPNARRAASAHGVDATVPAIEVANDTDAASAGSPNGEVNAVNAFEGNNVSAEFFVSVVVAACAPRIARQLRLHATT